MLCSSSTSDSDSVTSSGVRSPKRYRLMETLSNLPDFSEAFQCPPGSLMNPKKKCKVLG